MDHQQFANVPQIWKPEPHHGKMMKRLKKVIEDKYKVELDDYVDLHKWSVENLSEFWAEMWDFFGLVSSKKSESVIDLNIPMSESPKWFEGAKLNFAENMLKYRDDRIALVQDGENSKVERYTFSQMYELARLYAAAFRKFGLKKGDLVACYMSNRKEAYFAMYAVASIGAIWTGALPLLGSEAAVNRFKQVKPKVLLTVDRFLQEGEEIDMLSKVRDVVKDLPSLEKVLIIETKPESHTKDISTIKNSCFLDEFLELGIEDDGTIPPMEFEQVSFSHPLIINFTSGTTGLPKPIVHGTGVLMSVSNSFGINYDTDRDSVWLSVSPVSSGGSRSIFFALFFLGEKSFSRRSPFPEPPKNLGPPTNINFSSLFLPSGVELEKRGYLPTEKHDLSSLKLIVAGSSIVKPNNYDFMNKILPNTMFANSYGCTESMGICMPTEMSLPAFKTEFNAACLGTSVEVLDEKGNPVVGELGEIVITKPFPNLCLGLWGDEDGSLFREKYFSKYKEFFSVGDYGIVNPITKNWRICCRSDETLKQRGCRFGSSEIYNIVETFPEVRDSLCVSQYNKEMDERAVLFLKIRDGYTFSEELVNRARKAIAEKLTVRHVPDIIIETKEIPYNLNEKKLEIIVKKIINKLPYNEETVANPECLQYYHNVPELQGF
ncbi:Acetoacetyl-CoA synthetase like protein [Argiope bruennichi]|uniref:Acetoacetyl-CoA synthetase like protein n=1 Tax=Argiope bruennichi TaxID=94029 RepID=A0A8T0EC94_ARGBR|nr:Acetoacetyl-CoA synthetase like protein [Argiope bruennichi]